MKRPATDIKQLAFHDNLGMRLRGAYLSVHRKTNAHFAKLDATSDQFVLLSLLLEEDNISQQELARRSFSDANTVGAMLTLLERRHLICREADPKDKRTRRVLLTMEGRKTAKRLTKSLDSFHADLRATLPEGCPEVVYDWLARVVSAMKK